MKNENCDRKQRASPLPSPLINTSLQRGGPTTTPTDPSRANRKRFSPSPPREERAGERRPSVISHPTTSDHIRPNPTNFFGRSRAGGGKEKCNTTLRKSLKFNFIKLSKTFFPMLKAKAGKETVKFWLLLTTMWSAVASEARHRFVICACALFPLRFLR